MAIVDDKLLALKIPDVERSYTQRDPIFYALSLGFGQDPMNAEQLPFVLENDLKVLPTFPVVVAQPGMWARELDTGIDWVKIVHGEHDLVIHKPLPAAGTVRSHTRVLDVIDKGPGKGALVYSQRKVFDKASGDLVVATDKGDVSVVDRSELKQARRSLFGFNMPRLPFFAGDKSADDVADKLVSKVTAVKELGNNRYAVRIADGGALWETLEAYGAFHMPKVGESVEINRGPLGSYILRFGRQRGVKGRRVG